LYVKRNVKVGYFHALATSLPNLQFIYSVK
jgi:hypothetical protein